MKNYKNFNKNVNINIEDNTSYKDFASAVADILKKNYGQHNFEPFLNELNEQLSESENNENLTETIQAKIRNQLSPYWNLIKMFENLGTVNTEQKEKFMNFIIKETKIIKKNQDKLLKLISKIKN